jgi:hypothetical protein
MHVSGQRRASAALTQELNGCEIEQIIEPV